MMALLIKFGSLIAGLFGRKVSSGVAKAIGIAVVALLVVGVAFAGKAIYDARVIAKHEAAEEAREAKAALQAEREANAKALKRSKRNAEIAKKLEEATGQAKLANPVGAVKPVGPTTKAYYDTLRKEKKP